MSIPNASHSVGVPPLLKEQMMKYRGIVYDVGLNFAGQGYSVEPFDAALAEHDIGVIARGLHANAVRIEGEEIDRLVTAARAAQDLGLTVFFSPWKMHADAEQTRAYLREAAKAAEELRRDCLDIVFVAGCEYSIFSAGVFPGNGYLERMNWLKAQYEGGQSYTETPQSLLNAYGTLNVILKSLVEEIRAHFAGPVSYAAGSWEQVDWTPFDLVGIDHYRRGETDAEYVGAFEAHKADKPVAVMEVGCCAYEGAAVLGGEGFAILEGTNPDGTGIFKDGIVPVRSETEQADYVETQIRLLAGAAAEAVFIFVFSMPAMPFGEGVRDMDQVSFSLVKTFPATDARSKLMPPWEPKEAFHRVAGAYKALEATSSIEE